MNPSENEDDGYDYYVSSYQGGDDVYLRRVGKLRNDLWYYCTTRKNWEDEHRPFREDAYFYKISKGEALTATLTGVVMIPKKLRETYVR